MLVALFTTHIDQGFFVADGGFEHVLLIAGASVTLALAGPGRYSVDAVCGLGRRLATQQLVALLRATRNPQVKGTS
jgi:putative oxidoreductase